MAVKHKKRTSVYNKFAVSSNKRARPNKFLHLMKPNISNRIKYNLPVALTPFVNRQTEVEAVCQLLDDPTVRLVTLYGLGGIGKTRLSLEVGERVQNSFEDGVFFVNLAPFTKPQAGLVALAQALGLQEESSLALFETIRKYVQLRSILLILDNFEQIVALGSSISDLLVCSPRLKVLITSRSVLHLYGEHVYTVPTMKLPVLSTEPSFETLCHNEAISLFSQCAGMVNSEFKLTSENIKPIADLCVYLEGLPLAIELAAARYNIFSPQTLLDRLTRTDNSRFDLLVDGFSNFPSRQQTLTTAIEWSYNLLTAPEKQLFRRLGIFVGSFSLTAAHVINNQNVLTFETLVSLLNKSFLKQLETQPGEDLRFTMLETLREYALKKLIQVGELETVRTAYNRYFTELVEVGAVHLTQPDQLDWLNRLTADDPNIMNVLEHLFDSGDVGEVFSTGRQRLGHVVSLGLS